MQDVCTGTAVRLDLGEAKKKPHFIMSLESLDNGMVHDITT